MFKLLCRCACEISCASNVSKELICRTAYTCRCISSSAGEENGSACSKTEKMVRKLREKTPIGKLDEQEEGKHPFQEKEPLVPFPDSVNPATGEIGGPKGPEPTRYGDWERKGRVSDF